MHIYFAYYTCVLSISRIPDVLSLGQYVNLIVKIVYCGSGWGILMYREQHIPGLMCASGSNLIVGPIYTVTAER